MIHRFERPEPDQVTLDVTEYLQGVALRGWGNVLKHRKRGLTTQFNPYDIRHLEKVQKIYQDFASHGGLLLGYEENETDPFGFVLAANDVSGNFVQKLWKQNMQKEKVYAWIRHICIDAPQQGKGYFRPLLAEALAHDEFRPEQVPTAYIFDENRIARHAFGNIGFRLSPRDQEPTILPEYFAPGDPVSQRRYAGVAVELVIDAVRG